MTTPFAILLSFGLLCGMLLCLEIGLRIGLKRRAESFKDGAGPGFVALGGALFALLGLLFAFSFSGAATRFEMKRHLIVEEASAIETAYLRIDLLPAATQPAIREKFPQYLDARIAVYRKLPDMQAADVEIARAVALQREIWDLAVVACGQSGPATVDLVIGSLNAMIDIAIARTAALSAHVPGIIFLLLAGVSLVCSFMAGFDASARKTRSWVHSLGFAAVLAVAFYVILDLEYPRVGLIGLTSSEQVMVDVRHEMK